MLKVCFHIVFKFIMLTYKGKNEMSTYNFLAITNNHVIDILKLLLGFTTYNYVYEWVFCFMQTGN